MYLYVSIYPFTVPIYVLHSLVERIGTCLFWRLGG